MDISDFPTLAGVPAEVLAVEMQRFNFEEIRSLADAISEGIFDHVDTHYQERKQVERVLFLSSGKSIEDHTARLKCFTELQELAAVLHGKYERTKDVEDLNMNIFVEESCLTLSAVNGPPFGLLKSLRERHDRNQSLEDLERIIKSLQRVVGLVKESDPAKPAILQNLAGYLTMRYDSGGIIGDLNRAIKTGQDAILLSAVDDAVMPKLFNNLQAAFHRRFEQSENMDDLKAAILNGNCTVALTKDEDPEKPVVLSNLAECLHSRYTLSHAMKYLRQSSKALQEAIALIPGGHNDKPRKLDKLGRIFNALHAKTGALDDITQAIQSGEQAVSLVDDMHSSKPNWLTNLGSYFFLRFKIAGSLEDLDWAIKTTVKAVTMMPNRDSANTERLHYLTSYFRTWHHHTGVANDSVQAIENELQAASHAGDDGQVEVHPHSLLGHPLMSLVSLAVPEENISTCCSGKDSELKGNTDVISGLDEDTLSEFEELAYAYQLQFDQSGDVTNLDESIGFYRQALHLSPKFQPHQFRSLKSLTSEDYEQFEEKGDLGDLEESIKLDRGILDLQFDLLNNLAAALSKRFEEKGDLVDLEESIKLNRQALDLTSAPHPDHIISLGNLAVALCTRFEQMGELGDLEESIQFHRQELDLRPVSHPDRPKSLNNLANALCTQFEHRGDLGDLEESIKFYRQAIDFKPVSHLDQSVYMNNLANALCTQFEHRGDPEALEESIQFHMQALDLRPVPHPDRFISLNNLASALKTRSELRGDLGDFKESIKLNRQALDLRPVPHPDRFLSLNNLANSLMTQFELMGDLGDLGESIKLHRQALDLRPVPHPDRSMQALDLRPVPHPDRSASLSNLAIALHTQFEHRGDLGDLEESIKLDRQALDLRPAPHPDQSTSMSNLAVALCTRFEHRGDLEDLKESIKFFRWALDLRPVPHPGRSMSLNNLANALCTQFGYGGDPGDLQESIKFFRWALDLRPVPHPGRSTSLSNLANALSTQFVHRRDLEDLEESIKFYREALDLTPHLHPDRSRSLNNLADALRAQFEEKGNPGDLEESIKLNRQALDLSSAPHSGQFNSLSYLANALYIQFKKNGDPGDLEECIAFYRKAVGYEFAPVVQRLKFSTLWADHADSHQHTSAIEAYGTAIGLLPHLASLDMSLQQRQESLQYARGLACNAASCAIRNNMMKLAVEFLSAGRSVFWTQALHLRTPLDVLEDVLPKLAQKLRLISNTLESASIRNNSKFNSLTSLDIEEQLSHYRKLKDEWNSLLNEVRQTKGFEDFLQPMSFSKLCLCATNGPVILLNATKLGCDALIITLHGVKHVPLPNMDFKLAVSLEKLLQSSLLQNNTHFSYMSDIIEGIQKYSDDQGLRGPDYGLGPEPMLGAILVHLWYCVALPVISELQLQKTEHPSNRLWWCPTGPFVSLPIHAAGVHKYGETECMSNYCISSYSSTLQDLLVPATPLDPNFRMLAVIQPEIPGFPDLSLPGTIQELRRIEEHVPQPHDLIKLGDKSPATVTEVLKHLPNCSIAHFGCHGFQDPANPLNSSLHLEDGHLKMSEIIGCHIPKGSLAYLSACETAKGDASAPDEAMHIVATMRFAGFHGVVGTMWPIADEDAPKVADVFYRHLFQHGPHPDYTKAARALHLAVKELRDNDGNITFHRWVPFVHYGI